MKQSLLGPLAFVVLSAVVAFPVAGLHAAEASRLVKPGMKLAEVLSSEAGVGQVKRGTDELGGFLGRAGLIIVLTALAAVGFFLIRRKRFGTPPAVGGDGIRVLARRAISSKHSVVLLEVGRRRIVLGICGDRMIPLTVLEEGGGEESRPSTSQPPMETAPPPPASNGPFGEELFPQRRSAPVFPRAASPVQRRAGLEALRADDIASPWESTGVSQEDLEPYRRQVDRLRDLLESWRGPHSGVTTSSSLARSSHEDRSETPETVAWQGRRAARPEACFLHVEDRAVKPDAVHGATSGVGVDPHEKSGFEGRRA